MISHERTVAVIEPRGDPERPITFAASLPLSLPITLEMTQEAADLLISGHVDSGHVNSGHVGSSGGHVGSSGHVSNTSHMVSNTGHMGSNSGRKGSTSGHMNNVSHVNNVHVVAEMTLPDGDRRRCFMPILNMRHVGSSVIISAVFECVLPPWGHVCPVQLVIGAAGNGGKVMGNDIVSMMDEPITLYMQPRQVG
mgnify:CR=1 FL=1